MKTNLNCKTASANFKDSVITAIAEEIIIIIEAKVTSIDGQSKMLILSISKAACKLLHYNEEELIGRPVEDIFVKRNDAESLLKESLNCGMVCSIEKALRTKSGKKVHVLFSCCVKSDKENVAQEMLLVGQNITDRKTAEEALSGQTKVLQSILDNMADGVVLVDKKGKLIAFNPAAERILRLDLTQKDVLGTRDGFFLPDKKTPFPNQKRPLIRAIEGEDVDKCEVFVKHERLPGGIFISINARPLRNEKGEITGGVAVFDDITKQKKAEKELQYRMELENLITNISTSFINLTPDEIECGINAALKKIGEFAGVDRSYIFLFTEDGKKINNSYEWCADSDCVKPHMEQLQQIDLSEFPWFYKKIKNLEQVYVPSLDKLPAEAMIEKKYLEKEGTLSLLIIPMVFGKSLKGFLGFNAMRTQKEWCEDVFVLLKITGEIFVNALEHKKMLNAIKKAKEDLEQKVEERTKELKEKQVQLINSEKMVSLGQLVAGVAHEINTPLGALNSNNDIFIRAIEKIKGMIQNFEKEDSERNYSDFNKLIKKIEELNQVSKMAAERIINIVNNLRKFARLDQAEKDRVDIHSENGGEIMSH